MIYVILIHTVQLLEIEPVTKRCNHNIYDRLGQANQSSYNMIYQTTKKGSISKLFFIGQLITVCRRGMIKSVHLAPICSVTKRCKHIIFDRISQANQNPYNIIYQWIK